LPGKEIKISNDRAVIKWDCENFDCEAIGVLCILFRYYDLYQELYYITLITPKKYEVRFHDAIRWFSGGLNDFKFIKLIKGSNP